MKKLFFSLILFAFFNSYGQTWIPLDGGVYDGNGFGGYINSMAYDSVHNYLYVAGNFNYEGNDSAPGLAIWDGLVWQGIHINYFGEYTKVLYYHDTIYVADVTGRILKLYGTAIVGQIFPSMKGKIDDLYFYKDSLYACGEFTTDYDGTLLNGIAQWDGSKWNALGNGLDGGYPYTMSSYNDDLIVGGDFTNSDSLALNAIAAWNGKHWFALGKGIARSTDRPGVSALQTYQSQLYVGGGFDSAGGIFAFDVARWNGSAWDSVGAGLNGDVLTFLVKDSFLYTGGNFNKYKTRIGYRVASWNGNKWHDLKLSSTGSVSDIEIFNNDIIAGGDFNTLLSGDFVSNVTEYTVTTNVNNVQKENQDVSFFTNPTLGQLHIEAPNIHNATVTILNLFGQVVLQQQFSDKASIDISNLPKGMYLVNITDERGNVVETEKIVKE
ncbi:MAG: T9SS type A sorting domain-containing protein [Chitinophagales bacterium]|nr:T9SS type A sorting domain-containing protein [Chitinophagales bacterium]